MPDLFVSYKREDEAKVAKLVAALRADGLDTWWDREIPQPSILPMSHASRSWSAAPTSRRCETASSHGLKKKDELPRQQLLPSGLRHPPRKRRNPSTG